MRFQQTHNQGLRQLFLTVYWDLRSQRGTYDSVLVSLQLSVKVYVTCSWRCPWASAPNTAHLVVSLYLSSSGSNTWGGSRLWDGDKVVSGRNGRETYFPEKRSLICPRHINEFLQKGNRKNWVSGQTWCTCTNFSTKISKVTKGKLQATPNAREIWWKEFSTFRLKFHNFSGPRLGVGECHDGEDEVLGEVNLVHFKVKVYTISSSP